MLTRSRIVILDEATSALDPESEMIVQRGLTALARLVRGYFRLDGHHIQFNVVDVATLRAAQARPDAHRDLIVRVAGYRDYFCDLNPALQDEIIARTEHGGTE
jgi:pyruvate-formate lyase